VTVAGQLRAPSWDQGERRLEDHMLHVIHAGGQEGTLAGDAIRTRPGDLLWVPPGTMQVLRLAAGERLLHKTFLRFTLLHDGRPVAWPAGEPWIRPLGAEVQGWLQDAVQETQLRQEGSALRTRALLVLVFTAWMRAGRRRPGTLDSLRRAQLLALVAEDPGWTPATLARRMGMSPLHLTRQVRATWGMPLRRFLVESRLRAAAQDLRAGSEPIAAIAARHGWRDPFLFTRLFTTLHGVSPRAYRQG
jgi:AraC-like DNA-binding protein